MTPSFLPSFLSYLSPCFSLPLLWVLISLFFPIILAHFSLSFLLPTSSNLPLHLLDSTTFNRVLQIYANFWFSSLRFVEGDDVEEENPVLRSTTTRSKLFRCLLLLSSLCHLKTLHLRYCSESSLLRQRCRYRHAVHSSILRCLCVYHLSSRHPSSFFTPSFIPHPSSSSLLLSS
jgi:hypothetical protein